jgi:hypothetical protein
VLGRERSILEDSIKFVPHIQCAVKQATFVNCVILLHKDSRVEKFHSVKQ